MPRRGGRLGALAGVALGLVAATAGSLEAKPHRRAAAARTSTPAPKHRDPPPRFSTPDALGTRLAAVSAGACLAELSHRGVPFRSAGPELGVEAPVRLTGPVDGVTYRTDFPDGKREGVPWEVLDCRLVLALLELGPILRAHSISEVRIYCAYRPPTAAAAAMGPQRAHPAGLAIDVRLFKKSNGETLEVETDFHGRLGAATCGPPQDPPEVDSPAARELRDIYCSAAEKELFHVQLSPNHDSRHHNHFHLELRPGVRWFIVR